MRSPAAGANWRAGRRRKVLWDAAGTRDHPVRCRRVDITLSTDGGQTFPIELAKRAANTGRRRVVVPEIGTRRARVRVACAGNIFFAMSPGKFTIEP